MTKHTKLKCALVGYGYWGRNVLKALCNQHRFCLKGVYDSDSAQLQAALSDFASLAKSAQNPKSTAQNQNPHTHNKDLPTQNAPQNALIAYTSYDEILRDDEIEAVFIITPPHTHFPLASLALESGKHAFVEKPLARSTSEVCALYEIASRQNLTLHCDHIFLYSPAVVWLKDNLASFGDILYVQARRINLGLFQNSVNVIWDLALHDLSILDFLFGLEILSHSLVSRRYEGFEALANIQLECKRFSANLTASWLSPIKVREMMIGGTQKTAIYDETKERKIALFDCGVVVSDSVEKSSLYQKMVRYHLGEVSYPMLDDGLPLDSSIRAFGEQICRGGSDKWLQEHILRVVAALERICKK